MVKKRMPIGVSTFNELINNGFYYVDNKTKLIEKVINGDFAVALFPRPRRFGKRLNMLTLENFFSEI